MATSFVRVLRHLLVQEKTAGLRRRLGTALGDDATLKKLSKLHKPSTTSTKANP